EEESAAASPAGHPAATAAQASLAFCLGNRFGEPGRYARRQVVADRHARVRRPAFGDGVAVPLDQVVEAEAGTPQVAAASANRQPVVEAGRREVAGEGLERQRIDSFLAEAEIAAAESPQVFDPGRFEPDEIGGVMGDSLRVRLREADGYVGRYLELGHRA